MTHRAGHHNRSHLDMDIGISSENVERKYKKLYERRLNPFGEFKNKQSERRYNRLSLSEKCVYSVGRLVYRKRSLRSLMFFYLLILHILVVVTLWTHAVNPHC